MPPTAALLTTLLAVLLTAGCEAGLAGQARRQEESRQPVSGWLAVPAAAQAVEVTRHVDGDTLWVRAVGPGVVPAGREVVVRLLEIDAPETRAGEECFGERASAQLARLLPVGSRAAVARDRELLDPYGRHLLYVWDADGRSVNELMVRRGFATAALVEPNDGHIERMLRAEASARAAGRGLWGRCDGPAA